MKTVLFFLFLLSFNLSAQFTDDFSDGDFSSNPTWFGDVNNFEVDSINKLHLNDSIANTSTLLTNCNVLSNGEWIFDVEFKFSPSTNNFGKVYLASSTTDFNNTDAVYVKVGGQSGDVDEVSLYVQNGTNHNKIIDGVDGLVTNNPNVKIKVTRDDLGNWELFLDTNGLFFSQGNALDLSVTSSNYFGVYCKYTVTRSDKIWFDNFSVLSTSTTTNNFFTQKNLIEIIDLTSISNTSYFKPSIYIYDDGSVEKKIILK